MRIESLRLLLVKWTTHNRHYRHKYSFFCRNIWNESHFFLCRQRRRQNWREHSSFPCCSSCCSYWTRFVFAAVRAVVVMVVHLTAARASRWRLRSNQPSDRATIDPIDHPTLYFWDSDCGGGHNLFPWKNPPP